MPSSQAVTLLNNTLQSYIDGNAGTSTSLTSHLSIIPHLFVTSLSPLRHVSVTSPSRLTPLSNPSTSHPSFRSHPFVVSHPFLASHLSPSRLTSPSLASHPSLPCISPLPLSRIMCDAVCMLFVSVVHLHFCDHMVVLSACFLSTPNCNSPFMELKLLFARRCKISE